MEPFLEAHSKRPIRSPIHIQEGQAKVIAIRKDGISNSDIFLKVTPYFNVYPYHVTRFDPHKKIFDVLKKLDKVYDMNVVLSQTFMIEENNVIFFQLSPIAPGVAIVEARFVNSPQKAYSEPVEVTVSHVSKKLTFEQSVSFDDIWKAHPYNNSPDGNPRYTNQPGFKFQICDNETFYHHGCMVRFCTALKRAGISLRGMPSQSKCHVPGPQHEHHFSWPPDFEKWRGLKDAFVWMVEPPYQLRPMPGIAAYLFVYGKQGVILFHNYYPLDTSLTGGHIDLWNKVRMGNDMGDIQDLNPVSLDSAFFRSEKIVFWPM